MLGRQIGVEFPSDLPVIMTINVAESRNPETEVINTLAEGGYNKGERFADAKGLQKYDAHDMIILER